MRFKVIDIACIIFLLMSGVALSQSQRGIKIKYLASGESYYDYQDSWAVLIGINDFDHWLDLGYAVQDAEAIRKLLIEEFDFPEDHITLLTDKDATLTSIKRALGRDLTQVGQNDRVLVFWAGHGHTQSLSSGGEMGYLIPVDGNKDDPYTTCLSMHDIRTLADIIPAKHVLFLVDACYSGLATTRSGGSLSPETAAYLGKVTRARGRQIITAGSKDEEVVEDSRWGHSAFTYKLIDGLKNRVADADADGIITSTELFNYLQPRVSRESGYKQTPQFRFLSGDGEFVFITEEAFSYGVVGRVQVRTDPWSIIYLDGKEVGPIPFIIKEIPSGVHEVVLKRAGYRDIRRQIRITSDNRFVRIFEKLVKE